MRRENRFLRDRKNSRRNDYGRRMDYDSRNSYTSRSGSYVGNNRRNETDYGYDREYYPQNDYNYGYDYGRQRYDYGYDYGELDREYQEDLERWSNKLRRYDRFSLSKEEIINKAKQMGVKFEEITEEEFMAVYYMLMSDFKDITNDPNNYISLAKSWLFDSDIAVSPSEKLCIYMYKIVKGEE